MKKRTISLHFQFLGFACFLIIAAAYPAVKADQIQDPLIVEPNDPQRETVYEWIRSSGAVPDALAELFASKEFVFAPILIEEVEFLVVGERYKNKCHASGCIVALFRNDDGRLIEPIVYLVPNTFEQSIDRGDQSEESAKIPLLCFRSGSPSFCN